MDGDMMGGGMLGGGMLGGEFGGDMMGWMEEEQMWEDWIGGHISDDEWREIKEFMMKEWTDEDWDDVIEWVKENFDTKDWTDEDWGAKKDWIKQMKNKCNDKPGMPGMGAAATEMSEDGGDMSPPKLDKTRLELSAGIALLHTDIDNMENFPKCSYSVCHASETENAEKVTEWTSTWTDKQKSGEEFDCYYDPEDPTRAFVGKLYSRAEVVNAILWPSAFAIFCLSVLIGRRIYFGCTKKQVAASRSSDYAVSAPEPTKNADPEKDPASLGPAVETPRPLELSVSSAPPDYREVIKASGDRPVAIVLPPTYSEISLHKAARDELPICDA